MRLYLISEWPKRRKPYQGHDNEAKPRSVSGLKGRGEARRMSKARRWQTRGDGRGARGPPFRTRVTLRAAVHPTSGRKAIPPIRSGPIDLRTTGKSRGKARPRPFDPEIGNHKQCP